MNRILDIKYGLDDFAIVPEVITSIESRMKECNPFYPETEDEVISKKLPLFTSPMCCVIDETNWAEFTSNSICTILPRTVDFAIRKSMWLNTFVAVGLKELEQIIAAPVVQVGPSQKLHICLDIANGHMAKAIDLCRQLKDKYSDTVTIMAGNIANPQTVILYEAAGIEYARLSIGTGNTCTTSANIGVHYPVGSLIYESNEIRNSRKLKIKLIADGGFKNFDQINKALALGADYCMLGEILAKSEEACGCIIPDIDGTGHIYREYYGMSTKKAQMKMGKTLEECRTAEGIIKSVQVEYPLAKWVDNFTHFLRCAMSYTDCRSIDEFIGGPVLTIQSPTAFAAYKK